MHLRIEIFPADLEATRAFYVDVLGFSVERYEPEGDHAYLSLRRDGVLIGAAPRGAVANKDSRRPPVGVEIVLEVDDLQAAFDAVTTARWPVDEQLQHRYWGRTDFRVLDPDGYYLRVTD